MKRLICELHGSSQPLAWDEMLIKNYIEPELDYTSPIIPFQLAANLGKRQVSQCQSVYSRYTLDLGQSPPYRHAILECHTTSHDDEEAHCWTVDKMER